jgi:hypothetical protein
MYNHCVEWGMRINKTASEKYDCFGGESLPILYSCRPSFTLVRKGTCSCAGRQLRSLWPAHEVLPCPAGRAP